MGFPMPDVIIESVLRDGLENIKARPEILDDVFSQFLAAYADRKYGQSEIDKLKTLITGANKTEIAIVHSFHTAAAKSPCISIQLMADNEKSKEDYLDDHVSETLVDITDPIKLAALIKVDNFVPTSYNPLSGKVTVDDSVDLSMVFPGYIYEDGIGTEHVILAVGENLGDKFILIDRNSEVDLNPGQLRTFVTQEIQVVHGTRQKVNVMVGIHTKEALLTKYLYILVKFILKSRRSSLEKRCFSNLLLSGSDFSRDLKYQGDMVFVRFLNVSGDVEENWTDDMVDLIDKVKIEATPIE